MDSLLHCPHTLYCKDETALRCGPVVNATADESIRYFKQRVSMKTKTEPKKVSTPAVIEVPPFQDLILTVRGKPVVILRSDGVQFGSFYNDDELYEKHQYCGIGISVKQNDASFNMKYVGSCSTTMSLDITGSQDVENVKAQLQERYNIEYI